MAVLTYKCPNCDGPLVLNPENGNFKCEFCDSVFNKEFLDKLDDKVQDETSPLSKAGEHTVASEDGQQLMYTCQSCGAEIITDSTTAATVCYYCHNPVVLTGNLSREFTPDLIIPFKITKNTAIENFLNWVKSKKYVPADFFNERQLENVSGVYYPYWYADYDADGKFNGDGKIITYSSTPTHDITTTKHFNVVREGEIHFRNIYRSALGKADHKLAEGVHPYNTSEIVPFEMPYIAGFMAEKRDIEADAVKDGVENELKSYTERLLTSNENYSSLSGKSFLTIKSALYKYALLPSWIMTYKGKDGKIYYYAMNGQTASTCGKLPVDKRKLALHSGILAAVVFVLLCLGGYFLW